MIEGRGFPEMVYLAYIIDLGALLSLVQQILAATTL